LNAQKTDSINYINIGFIVFKIIQVV